MIKNIFFFVVTWRTTKSKIAKFLMSSTNKTFFFFYYICFDKNFSYTKFENLLPSSSHLQSNFYDIYYGLLFKFHH